MAAGAFARMGAFWQRLRARRGAFIAFNLVLILVAGAVIAAGVFLSLKDQPEERTVATEAPREKPAVEVSPDPSSEPSPEPSPIPVEPSPSPVPEPSPTPSKAPEPPPRTISMHPTSGPGNTQIELSGTGCTDGRPWKDPNAHTHGVGVTTYNPQGESVAGDGTAAHPDGTWRLPMNMCGGCGGPGDYSIIVRCIENESGNLIFEYPPQKFTKTSNS